MNVSFYCQHVLGIGHFHRSLAICRAIALNHSVTLILGGPPVALNEKKIKTFLLPGLEMDREFQHLVPCERGLGLNEVKARRREMLLAFLKKERPDVFITELYPFGRKAFRFELEPLLAAMRDSLPNNLCCCSVRDILVEKLEGREKFENRAVETLNGFFDGVLVHADPEVVTLGDTFARTADIRIPIHYTGFVTRGEADGGEQPLRQELGLSPADRLIVASIGGGNVGGELLLATVTAFAALPAEPPCRLQLFCGPYCDETLFRRLRQNAGTGANIRVDRFTDRFPAWLAAADLSISMAGYNTCMNLLQAGIPALVHPFGQNREQRLRAERLGGKAPIAVLDEADLQPQRLAQLIRRQLALPRVQPQVKLDGAAETARQLERWHRQRCHP
jgi:predicted glycosyltransferase